MANKQRRKTKGGVDTEQRKQEREDLKRMGGRIFTERKAAGFQTLRSFSDQVGISLKTLHNIEAGNNWPSLQVYRRICLKLGCETPLF